MNKLDVTFVRVYLTDGEGRLGEVFAHLHDVENVRGATVFRGISGFGSSGMVHSSTLLDMSLDLPVVIEFFDVPEKVDNIVNHLSGQIDAGHIVTWPASLLV